MWDNAAFVLEVWRSGIDGFGYFLGETGVLCSLSVLSGRLNVLCTELCEPSALGNIKAGELHCGRCCCFWLLFIDFMRGCGVV